VSNDNFNLDGFSFTPDAQEAQGYPRIYWRNGAKQAQSGGFFYASSRDFTELGAPWESVELYDDEPGFRTSTLKIAVIRKRSQAYSDELIEGNRVRTWHEHWKIGRQLYTELLCMMEGYDGLVTLVAKGLTGKALTAKNVGILPRHAELILKEAQKTWKGAGQVPPWAFWVPIGTKLNAKGKPEFIDTGYGSTITPPDLAISGEVSRDTLKNLFVGRELLDIGLEAYHDHAEWQKQLRGNEEPSAAEAPPSAPRNAPESFVSDDDKPF